jgi:predicted SAM-dependent methyltransferase
MPINTFSWSRSVSSYAKVQALVGSVIRNRPFQLKRKDLLGRRYLDIGCGQNYHEGFIHLDYLWHPGVDVCWDIAKGIPFDDHFFQGIFSQHCLEHFSLVEGLAHLREMRRVLNPGGTLRIIVPDGELYLRTYMEQIKGLGEPIFPYQENDTLLGLRSPILSVNRLFYVDRASPFGHRTIYDFDLLKKLLQKAGFSHVTQCQFAQGRDQKLLVDSPSRKAESLYVEGVVI